MGFRLHGVGHSGFGISHFRVALGLGFRDSGSMFQVLKGLRELRFIGSRLQEIKV